MNFSMVSLRHPKNYTIQLSSSNMLCMPRKMYQMRYVKCGHPNDVWSLWWYMVTLEEFGYLVIKGYPSIIWSP